MELRIDKIITTAGTQARAAMSQDTVDNYADHLRAKGVFPPIIVFKAFVEQNCKTTETYYLADGFHRLEAHSQIGRKTITADVRHGTLRDAILYAVGSNIEHGLRRTREDNRHAVSILLKDPEWSQLADREIGRRCGGVSHCLVGLVRNELQAHQKTRKVLRGNTTYDMELPEREARALEEESRHKNLSDALEHLKTARHLLEPHRKDLPSLWNIIEEAVTTTRKLLED